MGDQADPCTCMGGVDVDEGLVVLAHREGHWKGHRKVSSKNECFLDALDSKMLVHNQMGMF